ncbi:MAG: FGGY-family carbohydrate kinase, partial [Opitutaceae bacterium]
RPKNDREWNALIKAASKLPAPARLLDTTDPAFVNPKSMRAAVDAQLKRHHQRAPKDTAGYMRLICDSLGQGHANVAATFQKLSGRNFKRILMVGGGSRNQLLCQATADAAGIPLHAFELEGTAVGNIASQLVALKAVKSLATFRELLTKQIKPRIHNPDTK